MSEKNKLLTSILWKFLERSSVQIITLITQIVLARMISPNLFGSLSLIIVIYNLADLFVQKGFSSSLIRKKEISKYDMDTIFLVSVINSVFLYLIVFFTAPFIGKFYNNMSLVTPLRVLMVNLLIAPYYCIGNAILIRELKFKAIFIRGLLASIVSGISGIILAFYGFGLWALVIQTVMNQLVLTIVIAFALRWKPGTSFSIESFKDVFSFGKNILITEFLLYFVESIRVMVIGKYYSSSELAYYDRGQVYPATLMRAINDTIFSTVLPHLSKYQDDKEKLVVEYKRLTYLLLCIVVPIFFGFAAVSNEVVEIVLTEAWLPSVQYIQIFCIYQAIFPYQITGKIVMYAVGNSKKVLNLEIIKSVFSLMLVFIVMKLGPIYIALSLVAVRLLSVVLYSYTVNKEINLPINIIKYTWKPFLSSSVMVLVISLIDVINMFIIPRLIVKIILGVISYAVLSIILDRNLLQIVKRKAKK